MSHSEQPEFNFIDSIATLAFNSARLGSLVWFKFEVPRLYVVDDEDDIRTDIDIVWIELNGTVANAEQMLYLERRLDIKRKEEFNMRQIIKKLNKNVTTL